MWKSFYIFLFLFFVYLRHKIVFNQKFYIIRHNESIFNSFMLLCFFLYFCTAQVGRDLEGLSPE